MAEINVTPLVDVMLVLLIIFLITIPVVTQSVGVKLPAETNVPRQTKPENIEIAVTRDGDVYWGMQLVRDNEDLVNRLKKIATQQQDVADQGQVEARGLVRARGGPVKLLGEGPSDEVDPAERERSFSDQPLWKRLLVVFKEGGSEALMKELRKMKAGYIVPPAFSHSAAVMCFHSFGSLSVLAWPAHE